MSFWLWPGLDSGSKLIPQGNKICASSGFRNAFTKCEQTFSKFNMWIYFKKQGNILNICYHKNSNLIMCLKQKISFGPSYLRSVKTASHCVSQFQKQYELLSSHILFWLCLFFFYRFMSRLKGTLRGGKKAQLIFFCVAFKVWGIKGHFY